MKYLDENPSDIRYNLSKDFEKVQEGSMKVEFFLDEIVATLEVYRARTRETFPCTHCYRVFFSQRGLDVHKQKVRSDE